MAHEFRVVGLLRRPEYHQAVSVLKVSVILLVYDI